jgi:hypothetical protein
MSTYQKTTDLHCPALGIGWLTGLDLTATVEPIGESAKMVRSWNGTLINLAPEEFRQVRITLSGSGDVLPPAFAALWPGTEITIVPPVDIGGANLSGRTSHSTKTVDARGVEVPRAGYTALSPTRTYRRYSFKCKVVEPWQITHRDTRKDVSWSLVCEEMEYPAL